MRLPSGYATKGRSRPLIPIPTETIPEGTRCVQLTIPDSEAARRQLAGVLAILQFWTNYEREATHQGALWAKAWREALTQNTYEGCMEQTKLKVDSICDLQWSYDDWVTFESYDPSACILANIDSVVPGMIQDIIDGMIADGTLQRAGGQPSPTSPPSPGECRTYHVILRANDRWKIPSVINAGDTVHISTAKGGWTDGAFLWYCYDGKSYVLGTCGNNNPYQVSDPLQSGNHMQLIGAYNTTTPVYFDPLTALFAIPAGVVNQEAWIQANDSALADNQGEVEFDVEICTGAWCYKFDFTTGLHSWTLQSSTNMHQSASGLYSTWSGSGQDGVYGTYDNAVTGNILSATITLDSALTGTRPQATITNFPSTPLRYMMNIHASQSVYQVTQAFSLNNERLSFTVDPYDGGSQSMSPHVLSIEFHGSGINPFGADNC